MWGNRTRENNIVLRIKSSPDVFQQKSVPSQDELKMCADKVKDIRTSEGGGGKTVDKRSTVRLGLKTLRRFVFRLLKYQAGTTCGASSQRLRPRIISSQRVCQVFCVIRDKSAVFNILRQNVTIFDKGNGQRGRKQTENEEMRVNLSLHFLILSPFPLLFLILSPFPRARLQGSSRLRNPAEGYIPVLHHSLKGGLWVIT